MDHSGHSAGLAAVRTTENLGGQATVGALNWLVSLFRMTEPARAQCMAV